MKSQTLIVQCLLRQILDYLPTLSQINALDHKCTKDQDTGKNSAGQNKIQARFLMKSFQPIHFGKKP